MFKVTQWFGENPEYYQQFGLPGHEGIDFVAPHGQDIFAVLAGTVYLTENSGNYGKQVRIQHADGIKTIYAHLDQWTVQVNQTLIGGQKIGDADNTGNSSGSHLHMSEKQDGITYVDEAGIAWPFNFRDPWHHLQSIYNAWLNQNSIIGYLYRPGLVYNKQNSYARVSGTLNIRETPSSTGTILGQVTNSTVVEILSNVNNNYVQVRTPIDVTPIPPARSRFGLHFRADPDDRVSEAEYSEQQTLLNGGGETVKLLHNHPMTVYNRVCQQRPRTLVIRVFQDFGDRVVNSQDFYNWTVDELSNRVNQVVAFGVEPIIEVHNEPNLNQEGLGRSWFNGSQFAVWLQSVIDMYKTRSNLRTLKFMFPGLSPGGTIPGVRQDSSTFLQEAINAGILNVVDAVGAHAYWSSSYPIQGAINHVNYTKTTTGKPVYVTEASINDRPAIWTAQEYGYQYATFVKNVSVEGVYFFVGSASNPYFAPECWVNENGVARGIAGHLVNSL